MNLMSWRMKKMNEYYYSTSMYRHKCRSLISCMGCSGLNLFSNRKCKCSLLCEMYVLYLLKMGLYSKLDSYLHHLIIYLNNKLSVTHIYFNFFSTLSLCHNDIEGVGESCPPIQSYTCYCSYRCTW